MMESEARRILIARAAELARAGRGEEATGLRELADAIPHERNPAHDERHRAAHRVADAAVYLLGAFVPEVTGGQTAGVRPGLFQRLEEVETAVGQLREAVGLTRRRAGE